MFEIHKNNHNVNVFILKNEYVKSTAQDSSFDSSMKFLSNTRKVVRPLRETIDNVSLKFDKNFNQTSHMPNQLISLVGLLTENNSFALNASQSTIAGTIVYNYKKRNSKCKDSQNNIASYHLSSNQLTIHETPIVSYMSIKLYSCVRSKTLLQRLHSLEICSSYTRVIDILSEWARTSLKGYKSNDQVIPLKLKGNIFTVFTKDNIDKNSSPNQATQHFHGTSICAFQPTKPSNLGLSRKPSDDSSNSTTNDFLLPSSYTDVPCIINKADRYTCPITTANIPDVIIDITILNENQATGN